MNKRKAFESIIALLDEIIIITIIIYIIIYYLYSKDIMSPITICETTIIYIIIVILIGYKIAQAQMKKAEVGPEALIGKTAIIVRELNPEGLIEVEGELWRAREINGDLVRVGERVKIISHKGLLLLVRRVEEE